MLNPEYYEHWNWLVSKKDYYPTSHVMSFERALTLY